MERILEYLNVEQLWLGIDLLLAALLGFFIGLERKLRDKEAGIRTHTIVSFGAALMMIISKFAFDAEVDSARVVFLHCIFKKSERIVECISLPAPTRCDIINVWRVENGFE